MENVEQLLSIASDPIGTELNKPPEILAGFALGPDLFNLLRQKNGFYAFESALHVFPAQKSPPEISLELWNDQSVWRRRYGDLADGLLFFAEDIFQDQFCISQQGVFRFKAETGELNLMGSSIEDWAACLLSNHRAETGWPLARIWQAENGAIPPGKRLMPKTPFFLGGEYSLENFWLGDSVEGMRFKADLAMQTRNLPEGTPIKLHLDGRKN
jgi:hypothetical protein